MTTRLIAILVAVGLAAATTTCGPGATGPGVPGSDPDLGGIPFDVPDREPLADPAQLLDALKAVGVDVAALDVFHTDQDGTVYAFDIPAEKALPTWARLRPMVAVIGFYPVVMRDEYGTLEEILGLNERSASESIASSSEVDAAAWFEDRAANDPEYYGVVEPGEWEDVPPQTGWSVPYDVLSGEPAPGVRMLLVPTTRPWEVLAYLRYGDWNECPPTDEHVAVQRSWHERFGAEIVCVGGDVVEMRVQRPPTSDDATLALAREQFVYSGGDLVYQGYGSLEALASGLRGADYWYFWWD